MKKITVAELAQEISLDTEALAKLLGQLGMKDVKPSAEVDEGFAANARMAARKRRDNLVKPSLPQSGEPKAEEGAIEPTPGRLKPRQVTQVAKAAGLTKEIVLELDLALHNHACELAFLQGYQEEERKRQEEAAYQTGALASRLREIQRRSVEMEEQEKRLVEEGLSAQGHPFEVAKRVGVDIEGMLGGLEKKTTERAIAKLKEAEAIERLLDGKLTEDDLDDPFVRMAHQRFVGYGNR